MIFSTNQLTGTKTQFSQQISAWCYQTRSNGPQVTTQKLLQKATNVHNTKVNLSKHSGIRQLHFEVFSAIQV